MLKELAAVALVAVWTSQPASAGVAPPPVQVDGDQRGGSVSTQVVAPGSSSTVAAGGGEQSGAAVATSAVTCAWTQLSDFAENLFFAVGAGAAGGHFYDVRCSDGSSSLAVYVPPAAPNVPPAVVLAGSLAEQATNRLPLPAPAAQHNPSSDALVGLATWWWIDPQQWQSLQQRTQAGPVWAEVTARPVRSVWDAGDGSAPVVCAGPGRPYDRTRRASEQSSDCTFTYERSSASQPQRGPDPNDRFFTVTVTVFWQVSWIGSGGAGGALPEISRSSSFPLRVIERQTVVTGGSG